jgi:hypothetical protein
VEPIAVLTLFRPTDQIGATTVDDTLNIRAFEDLLDRLGEDVSHWRPAEREAAGRYLESPAAWALLDEALTLRAALTAPAIRAPAGLADRIVASAYQSDQQPTGVAISAAPTRQLDSRRAA